MKGEAAGEILKLTNRDIASITRLVGSLTDENIQALAKRVNPEIVEKIASENRGSLADEPQRRSVG